MENQTHSEDEVVETLLVNTVQSFLHGQCELDEKCQMAPSVRLRLVITGLRA